VSLRAATGNAFAWGALALLLAAPLARAADAPVVEVELVVSRISDEPGEIDPRARKLDRQLRREFRYQSLSVLQTKQLRLGIDEVGGLELPNGRKVRVKPLLVDERGALLAVDVEGSVKTDLRVRSDHLVVIGAQRHGDSKLVISLEPHF
jgi:hypothetical protein